MVQIYRKQYAVSPALCVAKQSYKDNYPIIGFLWDKINETGMKY